MSAVFTSVHLNIKAIAALTESGNTCLWMSRAVDPGADLRLDTRGRNP